MTNLFRVIGLLTDLLISFLNRRDIARRDDEVQAIRNDPAGQFLNEFGGVPDDDSKAGVPSGEAGAEVIQSERAGRH